MKWISSLLIFLLCTFYIQCTKKVGEIKETNKTDKTESKPTSKVHFVPNVLLTEVMNIAESEGKLIYMDVNAKWCTPCKMMQKDVYTDTETAQFLNENFVNHYVDVEVDEGPDIKLIFNIHVLPTLFILDSKGREVSRHEGALYYHDLMNFCNAALIKYREGK